MAASPKAVNWSHLQRRKGYAMTRVAIFYCKRIKGHTCIACAKCFKGVAEKNGEFAKHGEDVEIVAMTDDGDCPGLILPRAKIISG